MTATFPDRTSCLRVHSFHALLPGTRLIVLGAVHGNETCGTRAIERVLSELEAGVLELVRGVVTFVPVANPLAFQRGQRMGERNLNRSLCPSAAPQAYEDRVANALCPLLAAHEVLLDLHSFHTAGEPFALIGPADNAGTLEPFARAAEEEALALRLGPRRIVEGWLSAYAAGVASRLSRSAPGERGERLAAELGYGVGTTEYMRAQGGYAITLECGQHLDPQAPEVAYRAIRHALAHLRLVHDPAPAARADSELLRLAQVTDRLHPEDRFERAWASYDPVRSGERIGTRHDGTAVHAPCDGFIVFPNPAAAPGGEWFYFAERSARTLDPGAAG